MSSSLHTAEIALASSDVEARRQGVVEISALDGLRAIDLLMQGLGDPDWRVRKEAVRVLKERGARETCSAALTRLVDSLRSGDNVGLRNAAVEALGSLGAPAVSALGDVLHALDADGRKLAAEALALTGHETALEPLRRLCHDPDPNVRAAGTEAVAAVGHLAPKTAQVLLEERLAEQDSFQRMVTLDAIQRLGLAPSWQVIEPLLADPLLEPIALRLTARLGEPKAAPYYVAALSRVTRPTYCAVLESFSEFIEHSPQTLGAARQSLQPLPDAALERLWVTCQDRTRKSECAAALTILAANGSPRAAGPAIEMLGDDRVAVAAQRALQLLGERALPSLEEHLRNGQPQDRAMCIEALAVMATNGAPVERVRSSLRPLATESSPQVVSAWLRTVAELGDEALFRAAVPWLTDAAPVAVRRVALQAIGACARRYPSTAIEIAQGVAPESELAAVAAMAIAAVDSPVYGSHEADLAFLVQAVSSQHISVRVATISALTQFSGRRALEAVSFALTDEAPEVQEASLRALGRLRDDNGQVAGTPRLLELAQGRDQHLAIVALQTLGECQPPDALAPLARLTSDVAAWRAAAAVEALGYYPSSHEQKAGVQSALAHPESEVVKAALDVLCDYPAISPAEVGELALGCLDHVAWDVRRLAAELVGRSPSRSQRKRLVERLAEETEPAVIQAIGRGVAQSESLKPDGIPPADSQRHKS